MSKFIYLDTENAKIEGKDFLKVYILELDRKIIFKIYKPNTNENLKFLENFKVFQDVSNRISYVIKRDGKISLDIH